MATSIGSSSTAPHGALGNHAAPTDASTSPALSSPAGSAGRSRRGSGNESHPMSRLPSRGATSVASAASASTDASGDDRATSGSGSSHDAASTEPRRRHGLQVLQNMGGKVVAGMREQMEVLSDPQVAYEHGWGVHQTTRALQPFHTVIDSAAPKLSSTVRGEGAPTPTSAEAIPGRGEPPARAKPPRHSALLALQEEFNATRVVESHFQRSPAAERQALVQQIAQLQHTHALQATQRALLAKALATTFGTASQARTALQALGTLPLVSDIVAPRPATADMQLAWRLAAQLESVAGGTGLELLDQLSDRRRPGSTADASSAPPPYSDDEKFALRSYLRAAQAVQDPRCATSAVALDPASIYAQGALAQAIHATRQAGDADAWPGRAGAPTPTGIHLSLPEKALLAVHDELDPSVNEVHGCRFAALMVRAGMLTDAPRYADGQKSEFHSVESRAARTMGLHLNRVLGQTGWPAVRDAVLRAFFHKGKSPFFAYDAILSSRGRDKRFSLPHHGGTHEGRWIGEDMMNVLTAALQQVGGVEGGPLPSANDPMDATQALHEPETLRSLVRVAIIQAAKTDALFLPNIALADELPERALTQARRQVLGAIRDEGQPETVSALHTQIDQLLAEEGTRMTPQKLQAWAENVTSGGEVPGDWAAFAQAYRRTAEGERPVVDTPPLKGQTREDAAEQLARMVRGEELISGFEFSNIGSSSFTTKNVSGIVSGLLSAGAGVFRADLGGGKVRQVMFESGVSTDRSALRMSVATLKRVQVGAGGSIGVHLGDTSVASASVGVGGDAQYAYELLEQEGSVFGFPRHLSGGVGGDRALAEDKAKLLKLLILGTEAAHPDLPRPGNPEDQNSLVKQAYQAFGNRISVGRYSVRDGEHKSSLSVSGGPNVTVGHFKASLLPTGITGQHKRGTYIYTDHSGTLQVDKVMMPRTNKLTVEGGLASLNGLIDMVPASAGEAVTAQLQGAVAALGKGSADIKQSGQTDATIRIQHEGRTLPTSFATTTYARTKEWSRDIAEQGAQIADDKARKYSAARYAEDPAEARDTVLRRLEQYRARVAGDRDLTTQTQLYSEWGEHVDDINLLAAEADLNRRLGQEAQAQQAIQGIDHILQDPTHREWRFAIAIHTESHSDIQGPTNLLGVGHSMENRVIQKSGDFT